MSLFRTVDLRFLDTLFKFFTDPTLLPTFIVFMLFLRFGKDGFVKFWRELRALISPFEDPMP